MKISFGNTAKFELHEGWCQKGIKRGSVTPSLALKLGGFRLAFRSNVKKVPNGRVQGLSAGEMDLGDFPFRLKKSRK
jgi:hypothetical protein